MSFKLQNYKKKKKYNKKIKRKLKKLTVLKIFGNELPDLWTKRVDKL